jgi:hypothetical protein
VGALKSEPIGGLDPSRSILSRNNLHVALFSDFKKDRLVRKIMLNKEVAACRYPGSFNKTIDEEICADRFDGLFSFQTLVVRRPFPLLSLLL